MNELFHGDLHGARAPLGQTSRNILVWSLRPWWRALLFFAPLLAGGLWLSAVGVKAAWSAYRLDALSIAEVQRALKHDPDNPDLVHRLGLVYTYNPLDINTTESLKCLRKAVALNPRRWEFWADLGTACDFVTDTPCSDEAFGRAWALNPMSPTLGWTMGNHYLLTNRPEKAFPFFRTLLGLSPDYLEPTFRLCLRATHDPQQIYTEVLPHGKDGYDRFAFLNFLVATGDYENGMKIWGEMIAGPDRSPDLLLLKPFLNFLADNDRLQEATTVWHDLQRAGAIPPEPASPAANLIYNGNFQAPPLNTGFDWRVSNSPELVFDFSDPSGYQGGKCLRIDFSVGQNAEYNLLTQIVPVKPNTSYQLMAHVRSENLTSNSGPRLRVMEVGCKDCRPVTSDSTKGTTPWHRIDVSFLTQPQTHTVRISFWRPQAGEALGDITGTVWLGDVDLRAIDAPGADVDYVRSQ